VQVLRADLKTEIENTKALTSRNPLSSSKHNSKAAESKLGKVIRLYEELTGILITNVRHEPGQYKEEDAVYSCVQTTSNEKSTCHLRRRVHANTKYSAGLNFTLKFFQEAEEGETPSGATRGGRIVEKVIYTPQFLEKEAADFVAQLDFLASPFTFQKAQMNVFTKTLTSYLEGENEENQSDASHMEVEDD
jgi:Chromosome segregation protein Csm1/Pcs1